MATTPGLAVAAKTFFANGATSAQDFIKEFKQLTDQDKADLSTGLLSDPPTLTY